MNMTNRTLTITLTLALAACSDPASHAPIERLPLAEYAPEPEPLVTFTVSAMTMADGSLQNCEDLVLTATTPEDVEKIREVAATLREDITSTDGTQILPEGATCARQFAGRLAYARCSKSTHTGGKSLASVGYVYNADRVYRDDRSMANCIRDEGTWQALPEDSDEVRSATRRSSAHELLEASRQLQRLGGR